MSWRQMAVSSCRSGMVSFKCNFKVKIVLY